MSEVSSIRYPKNWTHEAIQKYLTQESQQKSREVFEKTHVPIRRIKVTRNNNVAGFGEEYIDEETFRDGVTASEIGDDNRMFFVVGESGSGKSELCQWLQYQLADRDADEEFAHVPIHIPRQVREPREVLGRLTEYLDETELDDAKQLASLPPKGVFEKTIGTVAVAFNKDDPAVDLIEDETFREEMRQNLEKYVEAFDDPESELEFEPIKQETLADLVAAYPAVKDEYGQQEASVVEELYDIVTRRAKDAIKDMLYVGDLKETLRQVDEKFQERNERPVLIIEDLTGFTIFQHEILSFFSDLGASHWDVVIGVTTGMEGKLIEGRRADIASQDTINDRIAARVTLTERTEEGAKTLFLEQEDVHIDLARTYLRAIKEESAGEFDPDIGVPSDKVDSVFGDDLYPFNERFLTRIYTNLQENDERKQTPRVYLKFVIEGLLDSDNPPFQQAELLDTLGKIRCLITADYDQVDRNVLKWYGEEDSETGIQRVDEAIPKAFGIDSDGTAPLTDGIGNERCPECGMPMQDTGGGSLVCSECDTTCDECGAVMEREVDFWVCTNDSSHRTPIGGKSELFQNRLQELLDWRGEGSEFSKTSHIEDGAERAIRFFHSQPTSLVRPECISKDAAAFWWAKGGDTVPIHLDNNDEPNYRKVILKRELSESLLKDLLHLGIYDQNTVEEHISSGAVDGQQLRMWAEEAVQELRTGTTADIEEKFGADIDRIALFGKYLLNIFTGNGAEFSAEALAQPVNLTRFKLAAKPTGLDAEVSKLDNDHYGEVLNGLFHARFHLRSNMVDYERLESFVERTSPATLCSEVAAMNRGITGYKIGTTRSDAMELKELLTSTSHLGLRTIARSLQEYADDDYQDDLRSELRDFTTLQQFYEGADALDAFDWGAVADAYSLLRSGTVPDLVIKMGSIDSNELSGYQKARERVDEISTDLEGANNVWSFLSVYFEIADLKYGAMRDYYKGIKDLREELESLGSDLQIRIDDLEDQIEIDVDKNPFIACKEEARQFEQYIEEAS
jgi:hypothetical protein